jgi:hypothetical protein
MTLRAQANDIVRIGEDYFRRMAGMLPSVPRNETELALMCVNQSIPMAASRPKPAERPEKQEGGGRRWFHFDNPNPSFDFPLTAPERFLGHLAMGGITPQSRREFDRKLGSMRSKQSVPEAGTPSRSAGRPFRPRSPGDRR